MLGKTWLGTTWPGTSVPDYERILKAADSFAAGHPPLVLGALDGKQSAFREIDSNGLLLGLSEGASYSSIELPFRPGDRCILYTDGVLEAKNGAHEEFGSSRFLGFLEGKRISLLLR